MAIFSSRVVCEVANERFSTPTRLWADDRVWVTRCECFFSLLFFIFFFTAKEAEKKKKKWEKSFFLLSTLNRGCGKGGEVGGVCSSFTRLECFVDVVLLDGWTVQSEQFDV